MKIIFDRDLEVKKELYRDVLECHSIDMEEQGFRILFGNDNKDEILVTFNKGKIKLESRNKLGFTSLALTTRSELQIA